MQNELLVLGPHWAPLHIRSKEDGWPMDGCRDHGRAGSTGHSNAQPRPSHPGTTTARGRMPRERREPKRLDDDNDDSDVCDRPQHASATSPTAAEGCAGG